MLASGNWTTPIYANLLAVALRSPTSVSSQNTVPRGACRISCWTMTSLSTGASGEENQITFCLMLMFFRVLNCYFVTNLELLRVNKRLSLTHCNATIKTSRISHRNTLKLQYKASFAMLGIDLYLAVWVWHEPALQHIDGNIWECFLPPCRLSFATDIARGMSYLHQHKMFHGRLHSRNCVIDDRWVCKISGNKAQATP